MATPRLEGMPGPPPDALARRHRIVELLRELHTCLMPLIEGLPAVTGSIPEVRYTVKIQGDKMSVTLRGGTGEAEQL